MCVFFGFAIVADGTASVCVRDAIREDSSGRLDDEVVAYSCVDSASATKEDARVCRSKSFDRWPVVDALRPVDQHLV